MLLMLVSAILIAYSPGLEGPFIFDDIINIIKNDAVSNPRSGLSGLVEAAWSGDSGPLKRPIAYLSFALNVIATGGTTDTFPFKLTNVLIHTFNALLVFGLARRIFQIVSTKNKIPRSVGYRWIPLVAAALWALHPLHTTAVLYVVQRMTLLSASFMLLGTLLFLIGRDQLLTRPQRGWILMVAGLFTGLLGLLAKENAILMPFLLVSMEYTLYAKQSLSNQIRYRLRIYYFVIVGIPLLLAAVFLLVQPDYIASTYTAREFGPAERMLTQARALWFYLGLIAVPDLTSLTLFHDDFPLSRGLLEPWTTLPAVIGIFMAIIMAVLVRRRLSLLALAILWFLVGHGLESTAIGLELVYEHRNYLPSVMVFIAVAGGLAAAFRLATPALLISFILVLTVGGVTFLQSITWSREDTLIESMARYHPLSARSQAMMGELLAYRRGVLEDALLHYQSAMRLEPLNPAFTMQMVLATARYTTTEQPTQPVIPPDLSDLSAQVSRQLAARRPKLSTLDVLDTAVNCVVEAPHNCRYLYSHVLRWNLALLKDPKLSPEVRAFAIQRVFTLTVWNKDYNRAIEIVTRAQQAEPGNLYYAFLAADLNFRTGELDKAERVARKIQEAHVVSELRKKADQLLSSIAAARGQMR